MVDSPLLYTPAHKAAGPLSHPGFSGEGLNLERSCCGHGVGLKSNPNPPEEQDGLTPELQDNQNILSDGEAGGCSL